MDAQIQQGAFFSWRRSRAHAAQLQGTDARGFDQAGERAHHGIEALRVTNEETSGAVRFGESDQYGSLARARGDGLLHEHVLAARKRSAHRLRVARELAWRR